MLEDAWDAPPDEHGYVRVSRGDGESGVYTGRRDEPIESVMFEDPSGVAIHDLVVEIARAGGMAIMPVGCPPCLADEAALADFPDEMAKALGAPVVVAGGRALLDVIAS